jgi:two-component system NtrC family sensor kinase
MRYVFFIVLAICLMTKSAAQNNQKEIIYKSPAELRQETINFLLDELKQATNEQIRLRIMDSLSMYYLYFSTQTDSSLFYSDASINIAFPLEDKRYLILAYARRANYFWQKTNLKAALENSFQGIQLSKEYRIPDYLSTHYDNIIRTYGQYANDEQTFKNTALQKEYLKYSKDPFFDQKLLSLINVGYAHSMKKKHDSAYFYLTKAYAASKGSKDQISSDLALAFLGKIYNTLEKYDLADSVFLKCVEQCKRNYDNQILNSLYGDLAGNYISLKQFRKATIAARMGLNNARLINDPFATLISLKILTNCYDSLGIKDSTFYFLRLTNRINDSLFNATNVSGMQEVAFSDQIKQKEKQANEVLEREKDRNKVRMYGFFTAIGVFLLIAFIMWRNSRQREKAYELLQKQKDETDKQKAKAEQTLEELKSTQAQLVQREKMASLGELTAGIAHEIQNPLNFVNNFSEVNKELLDEMENELNAGNKEEAIAIAKDIKENEEKINHHGQRADAIVKGMLQHSRNSSGHKEPTDINALAEEYLRLSYHGVRAKDKTLNATLQTNVDESIGKLNIIPQDIGRVLLNLYNNAFYAINEKSKQQNENYEPTISVSTKKINDKSDSHRIEVRVKDNGNGIPQKVLDKIFQPFFTTKPTGQGTGLGLSLSYDIVKAHGGELKVETKEGEGAEFVINL